jgi:hypothetical protein
MTEEKSKEELEAELESLRKARLEREIAKEKQILEAEQAKKKETLEKANKEKEEKYKENLEKEIREKLLLEMKGTSTVDNPDTGNNPDKVTGTNKDLEALMACTKKYGVEVKPYEQLAREISKGGFKGVR